MNTSDQPAEQESEDFGFWGSLIGTFFAGAIVAPLLFVFMLPFVLYQAWVFSVMWKWFVVPAFSLPPLQVGYAYGLLLIVYLISASHNKSNQRQYSKSEFATAVAAAIIGPTISLGSGWIVKTVFCS